MVLAFLFNLLVLLLMQLVVCVYHKIFEPKLPLQDQAIFG